MKNDKKETIDRPPKKSPFQVFVFFLGLLLVGATFVSFYYGNTLQNQINAYEKENQDLEILRNKLQVINQKYLEVYALLYEKDAYCASMVADGIMSELEANITIYSLEIPFGLVFWEFQENYLNKYSDDDVNWLFTEHIFYFSWIGYESFMIPYLDTFYTSTYSISDIDDWQHYEWINPDYSYFVFNWTLTWIYTALDYIPAQVSVNFTQFDNFVSENIQQPLINSETKLSLLEISINANTITVLFLSFLLDAEGIGNIWRKIYLILALLSVVITGIYSIFSVLRVVGI